MDPECWEIPIWGLSTRYPSSTLFPFKRLLGNLVKVSMFELSGLFFQVSLESMPWHTAFEGERQHEKQLGVTSWPVIRLIHIM